VSEGQDRESEDEARSLLHAARTYPAAPAEAKARALRRLLLALPGAWPEPPAAGGAPRSALSRARGLGRVLAARVPAWSLLVSFAAGGVLAAVFARRAPEKAEALLPAAPPSPGVLASSTSTPGPAPYPGPGSVTPAPAESAPAPAGRATSSLARAASSAPAARTPARMSGGGTLEAERAVLDVARTALGRGDGDHALRAIDEHARSFPHGALAEEREAMAIEALRLLHRDDDARARLERFRARFPTSLIRPALEAGEGEAR